MVKRYLHAVYSSVNSYVDIRLHDGSQAEGIFKGMCYDDCKMMFKNYVHVDTSDQVVYPMKFLGLEEVSYMVCRDLADTKQKFEAPKAVKTARKFAEPSKVQVSEPLVKYNFEVDTEVGNSKRKKKDKKKQMVKWDAEESATGIEEGIELDKITSLSSQGKFNQFDVIKSKFGIDTTYDEDSYTTSLNKKDFTHEDVARFTRMADDIEKSDLREMKENRHMLEERGIVSLRDYEEDDEENLYSAVVRKVSSN